MVVSSSRQKRPLWNPCPQRPKNLVSFPRGLLPLPAHVDFLVLANLYSPSISTLNIAPRRGGLLQLFHLGWSRHREFVEHGRHFTDS
jgi:hypothetical protein